MEARCLDEPADISETGEIGLKVMANGPSAVPDHAIGCDIASGRARRQDLLGGFPVIFHLYIRVAYIEPAYSELWYRSGWAPNAVTCRCDS